MDVGLTRECFDIVSPLFQFCDYLHFGVPLNRELDVKWTFFYIFIIFPRGVKPKSHRVNTC